MKQFYLTESYEVVLRKSIPAEIRQLILYLINDTGLLALFMWELTFAKRPRKHFL